MNNTIDGFLNIFKDEGITSNDVVFKLKKILYPRFGKVKIGHTGTLDPLACGVLPVALGSATKIIPYQMEGKKTYIFNIMFGNETETDDREGKVTKTSDYIPNIDEIKNLIPSFLGYITQTPPKYSAVKVDGKRAYELARQNIDFKLKPRENHIYDIKLLNIISDKEIQLQTTSDKGFYVRAFARDFAEKLNSAGYVSYLKRTANGSFTEDTSITVDKLKNIFDNNADIDARGLRELHILHDISFGLNGISVIRLNKVQNNHIRNGRFIRPNDELKETLLSDFGNRIKGPFDSLFQVWCDSTFSSIVKYEDGFLKPIRVF